MRSKVLALFRSLHRTSQSTFMGDEVALNAARKRINDEFRENKDETDPDEIKHMIKVGVDVELLMKKTIVQAKLNEKGRYEIRVTEDTLREDNAPPSSKQKAPETNRTETNTESR
ncbi:complex III assembly factor LYRM7-like [Asterias amurensis]|uniref:complex III assembly factor LYRM7-like n=1 Tax=Asterias amurensis TaxID=7602 RepID=UPI003AB19A47